MSCPQMPSNKSANETRLLLSKFWTKLLSNLIRAAATHLEIEIHNYLIHLVTVDTEIVAEALIKFVESLVKNLLSKNCVLIGQLYSTWELLII